MAKTGTNELQLPLEDGEPASQVKDEWSKEKPESQSTVKIEVVCTDDGESSTHSAAEEPTRKRKKGPAPKMLGDEVCSVCGDKASGFHYNVLSCEGCKGFFRRSVIKGAQYTCKGSGQCHMDMYMRRKCQECRLKKCRQAGMREECVLSEEQIRKKKIRKQQEGEGASGGEGGGGEVLRVPPLPCDPSLPQPEPAPLTPQQEGMIRQLVAAQQQCNKRSFSDQPKVTPWPMGSDPNSREARQQRFAHFTELAIISVQEIVDFAKQVPGFLQLSREDQIALLKASTIEIMLLETARRYNHETQCITFLKDFTYSKDDFHRAGLQARHRGGRGRHRWRIGARDSEEAARAAGKAGGPWSGRAGGGDAGTRKGPLPPGRANEERGRRAAGREASRTRPHGPRASAAHRHGREAAAAQGTTRSGIQSFFGDISLLDFIHVLLTTTFSYGIDC